jgi:hypothetical protein
MLSGCQDPIRSKIIGTWKIEHADKVSRRVNQDSQDDQFDSSDSGERMKLTFSWTGSLQTQTMIGQMQSQKKGSWELTEFDEQKSIMTVQCDLAGQQTEHKIKFIEDDLIRLVPPNMAGLKTKINFRRE